MLTISIRINEMATINESVQLDTSPVQVGQPSQHVTLNDCCFLWA